MTRGKHEYLRLGACFYSGLLPLSLFIFPGILVLWNPALEGVLTDFDASYAAWAETGSSGGGWAVRERGFQMTSTLPQLGQGH